MRHYGGAVTGTFLVHLQKLLTCKVDQQRRQMSTKLKLWVECTLWERVGHIAHNDNETLKQKGYIYIYIPLGEVRVGKKGNSTTGGAIVLPWFKETFKSGFKYFIASSAKKNEIVTKTSRRNTIIFKKLISNHIRYNIPDWGKARWCRWCGYQ